MQKRTLKGAFVIMLAMIIGLALSFSLDLDQASAATKAKTVTLKAQAKVVDVGGVVKVSVSKVTPAKASKKVTWKVTKGSKYGKLTTKAATYTKVKGLKAGKVTIKATSKSNKKATKTITLTVKNLKAKAVKLNKTKATLEIGKSVTLKATVTAPQKYGYKKQASKWKSSNSKVAKVTSTGKVTAVAGGTATITVTNDGKSATCKVIVPSTLKKFGITGYYAEGVETINTVPLDKELTVKVWNAESKAFEAGTTADINGNYTSLRDSDGNLKADIVSVVKFKDGPTYWDANQVWLEGIGEKTVPNIISDEDGFAMFGAEFRRPMGERLLTEFGIGDWSGVTDWANVKDGGYWMNNDADYYHLTSTDTLTMLTGYKTALQPSGSLCVMSSEDTVLEWYGQRGDLSDIDLALLRSNDMTEKKGTGLTLALNVFKKLGELGLTCEWEWKSSQDFADENDGDYVEMDSDWVQTELAHGHPIIVGSNSFGAHGQVIIGYDNMGTTDTLDDVCIMMDPYDTTDQDNNGYIIQPFERMQYSVMTWESETEPGKIVTTGCYYFSVWPKDPEVWDNKYEPVMGSGLAADPANKGNFSDEMKLDYGRTADDITAFYPDTPYRGENGLAGAATGGYERSGDYDVSPYYTLNDFYNLKDGESNTKTLKILENFKTIQQSTEWTCGTASALMNIEWFGKNEVRTGDDPGAGGKETDVSLAQHRQNGRAGATSCEGMKEVFKYMSDQYGQKWTVFTNSDMLDPEGNPDPEGEWEEDYIGDYCLQAGDGYEDWYGLIPYLIDHGIPMMVGSDEWGGHWQVIIGYDGMGTEATEDDVLIMADPYDTTDHNQDGYFVKGFERLIYGWGSAYEKRFGGTEHCDFIVAFPTDEYQDVVKELGL